MSFFDLRRFGQRLEIQLSVSRQYSQHGFAFVGQGDQRLEDLRGGHIDPFGHLGRRDEDVRIVGAGLVGDLFAIQQARDQIFVAFLLCHDRIE